MPEFVESNSEKSFPEHFGKINRKNLIWSSLYVEFQATKNGLHSGYFPVSRAICRISVSDGYTTLLFSPN